MSPDSTGAAVPDGAVLVLGGTTEGRLLADALVAAGLPTVTALAGRTRQPWLPGGTVRAGGFGGRRGLAAWLGDHGVRAVVDASHPFAARISAAAAWACASTATPLLRLERPAWRARPDDRWHRVGSLEDAAALVPRVGRRAFLTVGRQGVAPFAGVEQCWFLIRSIEAPPPPLPPAHTLLRARGPFALADELALLDRFRIDVLVTKDSGGSATEAKLEAARLRRLSVVIVDRPPAAAGNVAADVASALAWVRAVAASPVGSTGGIAPSGG